MAALTRERQMQKSNGVAAIGLAVGSRGLWAGLAWARKDDATGGALRSH